MQKVLFIDRDGTLVHEPKSDQQVDSFEKLEFLPGVFSELSGILKATDYIAVMVSNQDGLGTDSFPEEDFWPVQNFILKAFANEGVVFEDVFIDRSFEQEKLPTRKPGTGMLSKYIYGSYDMRQSYVIGDRDSDTELARRLGCKSIQISDVKKHADYTVTGWKQISDILIRQSRRSELRRETSETQISLALNLDGSGRCSINTGLYFFDHMLEQIGKHGGFDLDIDADGDLQIDEHHTIEDVAICLGQAFDEALASRRSIERYAFILPMDESKTEISIDLGGRSQLVMQYSISREYVGDFPVEMLRHFFKSFCDSARCTLHIKSEGENAHHIIESMFKAFARVLRKASRKTGDGSLPSTKGLI